MEIGTGRRRCINDVNSGSSIDSLLPARFFCKDTLSVVDVRDVDG